MTPEEQRADTIPPTSEPPCQCDPPTPWLERKYNGTSLEMGLEMRTCTKCIFTMSKEIY